MIRHNSPVEEALRRSHCAHADKGEPGHDCRGSCTITRDGVVLECNLCGADNGTVRPYVDKDTEGRAKRLAEAFGVHLEHFSNERYDEILKAVAAVQCKFCGAWAHGEPFGRKAGECPNPSCKALFSSYFGWERPEDAAARRSRLALGKQVDRF